MVSYDESRIPEILREARIVAVVRSAQTTDGGKVKQDE